MFEVEVTWGQERSKTHCIVISLLGLTVDFDPTWTKGMIKCPLLLGFLQFKPFKITFVFSNPIHVHIQGTLDSSLQGFNNIPQQWNHWFHQMPWHQNCRWHAIVWQHYRYDWLNFTAFTHLPCKCQRFLIIKCKIARISRTWTNLMFLQLALKIIPEHNVSFVMKIAIHSQVKQCSLRSSFLV